MQRAQNNGCGDEIHFVRRQRSGWNPYKRKDWKYERNLRDESGISALIHKSKAWCLMCCCWNRTKDAEAGRQTQPDTPLISSPDPADGHRRLTIISKQEATNLTTVSGLRESVCDRVDGPFWPFSDVKAELPTRSQAQSTINAPWWSLLGSAAVLLQSQTTVELQIKTVKD